MHIRSWKYVYVHIRAYHESCFYYFGYLQFLKSWSVTDMHIVLQLFFEFQLIIYIYIIYMHTQVLYRLRLLRPDNHEAPVLPG